MEPSYSRWLQQAENDLAWGYTTEAQNFYAQACFIAQQVGEKSLKALAYFRGAGQVKPHSILKLCKALNINDEIEEAGRLLDQYYISTRYPDALPEDLFPAEFFSRKQAQEALHLAQMILNKVKSEITPQ